MNRAARAVSFACKKNTTYKRLYTFNCAVARCSHDAYRKLFVLVYILIQHNRQKFREVKTLLCARITFYIFFADSIALTKGTSCETHATLNHYL